MDWVVSVTSVALWDLLVKEQANKSLCTFIYLFIAEGCYACCCGLHCQHLYSNRASSLNLDLTAWSLCHTGAGGGELRRILTSLHLCAQAIRSGTFAVYPCQVKHCVACQEEPLEANSIMCPLALMAASVDWRRKTPWRIIHLNSHLSFRCLAKHAWPL